MLPSSERGVRLCKNGRFFRNGWNARVFFNIEIRGVRGGSKVKMLICETVVFFFSHSPDPFGKIKITD